LLQKGHTNLPRGENKLFTKPKQRVISESLQESVAANNIQEQIVDSPREGDNNQVQQDSSYVTGSMGGVALRTIPVYLKNGNKKLKVNALLDVYLSSSMEACIK